MTLTAMLSAIFSSTVLVYFLVLLVGAWGWFQWSHRRLIRVAKSLPNTYPSLPLLGHAHYTFFGMENLTKHAMNLSMSAVTQGVKTVCFWCGPLPIIMVHGLEDIQKILNSSITAEKGDEMDYMKHAGGHGLLTAPLDIWRITRRHINPLFHFRNVEQLSEMFNRNSRELVATLSDHVGCGPVNVMDHTMDMGLKSVCNLIFGPEVDIDVKSEAFRGLLSVVEKVPDLFIKRVVRVWLRIDAIFQFLYRKELKEIETLWKNFTEAPLKVTKEKNALKKAVGSYENEMDENTEPQDGPINLLDVYSVLQKNYPQFTDNELKTEMVTLYCTGTDTVGAAVASCMLVLAQYQDVQEKLLKEISSTVGPDDDVTQDDIRRMPYLDQVYKETLRWSAIVPYVLRKPSEDLKLSTCTIPAGNTIIVCLRGIHMNPKIYPDPEKFDPERFSAENMAGKERYSFIPYSGGPRNCIGKTYAQMLVETMLIHVLRRFKLSTTMDIQKIKRRLVITLVSAEGYNISLERRT